MASERAVARADRANIEELGQLYLAHLENVRGCKPTTLENYRSMLQRHLIPFFGSTTVDRLRVADVEAFVLAKRREGLGPKTTCNVLTFLHGLLRFGVRRGTLQRNPADDVERPRRAQEPIVRHLSCHELEALLRAVPGDQWAELDRIVYRTAGMTGLRQGELLALRWCDVDLDARVVRVRRSYTRGRWSTPKSARSVRAVPMAADLQSELRRYREASAYATEADLVFAHPQRGTVLDPSRLRRRFREAARRAGLPHVRFHDLRHTYGTAMAAAGTPMRMLQEWMGHRSHTTTLVYAAYSPDASHGLEFVDRAFRERGPDAASRSDRGLCSYESVGDLLRPLRDHLWRFETAAPRWHARLCSEAALTLSEAQLALAALHFLRGPGAAAGGRALVAICGARGVTETAGVLNAWLDSPGVSPTTCPRRFASDTRGRRAR